MIVQHNARVRTLSDELRKFPAQRKKIRIKHGSTNSTRSQDTHDMVLLDITSLSHIVEVNKEGRYALVEPNVPMDALVEATLRHNLVPQVVMEFPGITVGGGIQGGAGESSSFKYGLFHDTCDEYEVLLGDGRVMTASRTTNDDLFWGTASSCGTLGVLTLAKVKLVPATTHVLLTYTRVSSSDELNRLLVEKTKQEADFLDGILYAKDLGVVVEGRFSERTDLQVSRFRRAFDEWFYLHARAKVDQGETHEELVPIRDYLFRYDRGAFWAGKYTMARYDVPFNRVTRFLLNPFFTTRRMYQLLHLTGLAQQYMVQDICVPDDRIPELLSFVDERLKIYPLWFCPLRVGTRDMLSPSHIQATFVMNVGVWGGECKDFDMFRSRNRELESVTKKLGGRKVLYAHVYYPESDFWEMYDKEWYDRLRTKYSAADSFPNVYEKVFVSKKYDVSIKKGLLKYVLRTLRLSR